MFTGTIQPHPSTPHTIVPVTSDILPASYMPAEGVWVKSLAANRLGRAMLSRHGGSYAIMAVLCAILAVKKLRIRFLAALA